MHAVELYCSTHRKFSWLVAAVIFVFAGAIAAVPEFSVLRYYGYGAAAAWGLAVCVLWRASPLRLPLELGLMLTFVLWCAVTGYSSAVSETMFSYAIEQCAQVLLVATLGAMTAIAYRSPSAHMVAGVCVAVVVGGYGIQTGGIGHLETQREAERMMSLLGNANSVGILCLWGLIGCAYWWSGRHVWWRRPLLVTAACVLILAIILTASRKSLFGVFVLLAAWVWFCYRQRIVRNVVTAVGVAVLGFLVTSLWGFVMENTLMGKRVEHLSVDARTGSGGLMTRIDLYREALGILSEHPVAGVGLLQTQFYSSSGLFTHSDLMEVFAGAGVVGGGLYVGTLVLMARRLWRVQRVGGVKDRYSAGIGLTFLTVFGFVGLGAPLYANSLVWCFLSGFIGFGYRAEREMGIQDRGRARASYGSSVLRGKRGSVRLTKRPREPRKRCEWNR